MAKCFFCGNDKKPRPEVPTQTIQHTHEGVTYTDTVKAYNDAFFEIVKGRRKGNLVHRWHLVEN